MISAALAVLESEEQRNELSEIYENNISNFYNIAFQQLHNKHDAEDRKSTRLNSSHTDSSRMPSSA